MRKKTILFFWIIAVIFALAAGCNKPRSNPSRPVPIRTPSTSNNSPKPSNNEHPFGNPFAGVLPWEETERFQAERTKNKVLVRMAAFKTTLPDPLPGEESNVARAADYLAGKIIQPGQSFSLYRTIGPFTKSRGYHEGPAYRGNNVVHTIGGGVCKIASTLYNVVTLGDLKILERHPHGMPVPYVPSGQDATISNSTKDFRFMNNTDGPVLIWADTRENTLYMALYGRTKAPEVIWHHQILRRFPTHTLYRVNKNLKPGEKKVIVPGADGLHVKSWLTVKYPDGRTRQRNLGIDYYRPLPHLVERG